MMSIFTDFDCSYGDGVYSSIPNVSDGYDVIHDGSVVGNSDSSLGTDFEDGQFVIRTPNLFDGTDTIVDGSMEEHTQDNLFGGEDIYHGTDLDTQTIPNEMGGENIYDGDMQLEGISTPNLFGGEDYLSFEGNTGSILDYDDPLRYVGDWQMEPFDVAKL